MRAIIITIGDEILLGQVLDTNSHYISGQLTRIGIEVVEKYTIPDQEAEIAETVAVAMSSADLIIVTGGLGPTKDDVTKHVLAACFDSNLVMNDEILDWIEQMVKSRGGNMNERNISQALLPDNCRILKNYKGTASGMWFLRNGKSLISLPGVPFEMEHLMEMYVIPDLKKSYPELQIDFRMVKVYDIPESELAMRLEKWEEALPTGLGLAYLPSSGLVKLRLTAKEAAISVLDIQMTSLKQMLKGLYYTDGEEGGIEKELGRLLQAKNYTVATAESCTGGYVAHLITSVPGSSVYFKGSVVAYSNEVKENVLGVLRADIEQYGAVSEQVVVQMAKNAKKLMKTDCAIATSGVAGPEGGTPEKPVGTVWIAVAIAEKTIARRYTFSFSRERNIAKSAVKALMLLVENIV